MKASLQILDSDAGDADRRLLLRTKIRRRRHRRHPPLRPLLPPHLLLLRRPYPLSPSPTPLHLLLLPLLPLPQVRRRRLRIPGRLPLVLSARFDLARPGSAPVFSLHLRRPRFGHFSLKRSLLSSSPSQNAGAGDDNGLISGVSALTRSEVPVGKSAAGRLRWAVNFPTYLDKGVPFLTLDKLSVERVEDAVVPAAESAIAREAVEGMGRDAEGMKRDNASMKLLVGELKSAAPARRPPEEKTAKLERWRTRRKRADGEAEVKAANAIEEELRKQSRTAAS